MDPLRILSIPFPFGRLIVPNTLVSLTKPCPAAEFAVPARGQRMSDKLIRIQSEVNLLCGRQQICPLNFAPRAKRRIRQAGMRFVSETSVWHRLSDPKGKDDAQGILNEIHVPLVKEPDGKTRPVIIPFLEDVIFSFKVIALRITQDAIPGNAHSYLVRPTRKGRFRLTAHSYVEMPLQHEWGIQLRSKPGAYDNGCF